MKHIIDLPPEIERALENRASETGHDVAHLIEVAVAAFVRNGAQTSSRRKPDMPLEAVEGVAPCDLPRSPSRVIAIEKASRRMPDPIADPT
jgi:hypothetical protein